MELPELPDDELRVLGALVEKELATPQQYPLTLNALVLACNQTTGRDPVVEYSGAQVEQAVTSLKQRGLARFVHPSHGRSALRYEERLGEVLELETLQVSLLALLILRGAQTPGELRQRADRLARFESIGEVESVLDSLAQRCPALVTRLGRVPGQREERFAHLLGGAPPQRAPGADPPGTPGQLRATPRPEASVADAPADSGRLARLEVELAAVRDEVALLRLELEQLRSDLGS